MGRPKNPTIVSGRTYVWVADLDQIPQAKQDVVPLRAVEALTSGETLVEIGARRHALYGVVLGSSAAMPASILHLASPPLFVTYGVVGVGRVPGIPVEVGLFRETARERQWLAAFGPVSCEAWAQTLGLPEVLSLHAGALRVCSSDRREQVRKEVFDAMRAAETTWRAPCP